MKNLLLDRSEKLNRPLVLDGAMGSLLQMKGIPVDGPLWSATANFSYPEEVKVIHKSYLEAGADIITTNTFRTNPHAVELGCIDKSSAEFVEQAVKHAKESVLNEQVFIAGSNAPAEDCYKTDRDISFTRLYDNHAAHIELLFQNEVDIIWNETFSHMDEIQIVCEFCSSGSIPYVINLFVDSNLRLLSGESISDTLSFINDYNPLAIGINCISINTFFNIIKETVPDYNWGFYLNCGSGSYTDTEIKTGISPVEYITGVRDYLKYKPLYVGSCCGSTPEHTRHLKELILEIYSD